VSVKIYNLDIIKDMPASFDVDVSDLSLGAFIDYLETNYSAEIKQTIFSDGKLEDSIVISINGLPVNDMEARVPDGCTVVFSFLIFGG